MLHQVYMSNLFKLDYKDYLNGFLVTVGGAITATLLQIIMNGGINLTKTDWETVMTAAVVAGLTICLGQHKWLYMSKKNYRFPSSMNTF